MGEIFYLSLCPFFILNEVLIAQSKIPVLPLKGICAHLGAVENYPEIRCLGAQMIEFDVQFTKDNQLIVIHDSSLDRTTKETGSVHSLTLAKIKKLDAR